MHTHESRSRAFYADRATDVPKLDDRMTRLVAECVALAPRRVLDIGCARGFLLGQLKDRLPGIECFGLELSSSLAAMSRADGITVFEQDIAAGVPLPSDSLDVVVMGEVIEHVFDPDACLEEIRRLLKPSGHVIVTTPNLAAWYNRIMLLFGMQPIFTETSTRKKYGHGFAALGQGSVETQGHLKLFTLGALRELLDDVGYAVERVSGYKFYRLQEHAIANVAESVFRLWPTMASGFIVVARKPAS
ncbi:MAG TPA: class I SAM-dependent methyltransferase [Candidatus Eremiobacteraceae bacterium]|nr:class I SAM-dependent methyltransferase [Candidatus Eremiobacteraceae bacterium]